MKTQMRAKRIAPPARCQFFDFREKFGRHSRRGKKTKIAAARLCGLILRCFRGELRQGFSAREANGERIDQFLAWIRQLQAASRLARREKVRSPEPDGLR